MVSTNVRRLDFISHLGAFCSLSFCFTELPDFLSDDESEHIIDLAEMWGLENSYMHSDEFQEQHKKEVKGKHV